MVMWHQPPSRLCSTVMSLTVVPETNCLIMISLLLLLAAVKVADNAVANGGQGAIGEADTVVEGGAEGAVTDASDAAEATTAASLDGQNLTGAAAAGEVVEADAHGSRFLPALSISMLLAYHRYGAMSRGWEGEYYGTLVPVTRHH